MPPVPRRQNRAYNPPSPCGEVFSAPRVEPPFIDCAAIPLGHCERPKGACLHAVVLRFGTQAWQSLFFIPILVLFILSSFPDPSFAFRNHGAPVKEGIAWGVYAGPGKTGRTDTIYIVLGRYKESVSLLAVHPDTGEIRQYNGPLPDEMGSWGFTVDQENRIYLGSYYHAHLLRFDPKTGTWDDLGRPAGESESFICALTMAPDGKIWGGTFPSAKLFSFDPKTGETKNFGRMDEKQFYCYPTAGGDGLIYCAIRFEKTDIVVFDPAKETRTSLITLEERRPGWLSLTRGDDGKVYARIPPSGRRFRIERGKDLIGVSESEIPFPKRGLPDGRTFQIIDNKILRIENPATGKEEEITLQYEASGAYIFVVGAGPDGRIYGSSMLPLRLFAYDPQDDSLTNLGKASHANGEVYSMGSFDGKLYLCSYPDGRLSVYDPKKPYKFGDGEEANPRDVGPMGEGIYRPRTMVAGPEGKVIIGGYPDYGLLGGAISVYDLKQEKKRTYRHVIPNQSIASLAFIEKLDLIAGGSSVRGGTGTRAIEKEAKLILWDPKEEKKIFEMIPILEAKTILSLAASADGMLYGITDNEKVFVFDVDKRVTKKVMDLGFKEPREISLRSGADGRLYGLAREAIFVIDTKDDQISLLAKPPLPISTGMAILGRKIYYGSGANLYEFEIPPEPVKSGE
jgi:outer membrane protein assembly factor BamB